LRRSSTSWHTATPGATKPRPRCTGRDAHGRWPAIPRPRASAGRRWRPASPAPTTRGSPIGGSIAPSGYRPRPPTPSSRSPAAPDSFVALPAADSAMGRAALLARLGLGAESRWEYDRLLRQSDSSAERLLALAAAFRRDGFASQAIQLARRALALGAPADARTYPLLYPVM